MAGVGLWMKKAEKSKKNERTVKVDIEVEEFYEITTGDEGNNSGDSESNQSKSLSSKKKKKYDNLAKFEKKMS